MDDGEKSPGIGPDSEEGGRQPIFNIPAVVAGLAGAMVLVWLADSFILNDSGRLELTLWFGFLPYRWIAPDEIPGGLLPLLWTPVTHGFLHAGFEHLLFNVIWLVIFATPIARRYGAVPTLIIFAVSAAIGAAAFAATTLPQLQVLVGASGGVAGLTGAATRVMFQPVVVGRHPETGEPVVLGRHLASLREVLTNPRIRIFTLIWVVLNAAVPLLPLLTGGGIAIAWQAHLGGFFTGLLLVQAFERRA